MGTVMTNLAAGLDDRGHDIVWVSRSNYANEWRGNPVVSLPSFGDTTTEEILQGALDEYQPDVLVTNRNWQDTKLTAGPLNQHRSRTGETVPVVLHTTAEAESVPPGFAHEVVAPHENPVHVLPYTEPSYQMFSDHPTNDEGGKYGRYCRDYIPHGVSETYLDPDDDAGGGQAEAFGHDDAKMVLTVAANESKKNLDLWLRAASKVKDRYDGDVVFVQHTTMDPARGGNLWNGWNLARLAASYDIDIAEDIRWTKPHPAADIGEDHLRDLYADADCYLSLSGGEGFGLPPAEALAMGTPCVLTDHMNHRYVCGPGAKYVEPATTKHNLTGGTHILPETDDAAEKVVSVLNGAEAGEMAEAGRSHVRERFRWGKAADKLETYLEEQVLSERAAV